MRESVVGVERDRSLEEGNRGVDVLGLLVAGQVTTPLEVELGGARGLRVAGRYQLLRLVGEVEPEEPRHASQHFILEHARVARRQFERVCAQQSKRRCVGQIERQPQAVAAALQAAVHHGVDAKRLSRIARRGHVLPSHFIRGHHAQPVAKPLQLCQPRRQHFRKAIRQRLVGPVAIEIQQRQYRNLAASRRQVRRNPAPAGNRDHHDRERHQRGDSPAPPRGGAAKDVMRLPR